MTIFEAQRRLARLDIIQIIEDIIQADSDIIVELNQKQLLAGKNNDGSNVKPDYASQKYAEFKQQIAPNSERGLYTPNLYLTGNFYSTFFVLAMNGIVTYGSDGDVNDLEGKYGSKIFGLTGESKKFYIENYLLPKVMKEIDNLFS